MSPPELSRQHARRTRHRGVNGGVGSGDAWLSPSRSSAGLVARRAADLVPEVDHQRLAGLAIAAFDPPPGLIDAVPYGKPQAVEEFFDLGSVADIADDALDLLIALAAGLGAEVVADTETDRQAETEPHDTILTHLGPAGGRWRPAASLSPCAGMTGYGLSRQGGGTVPGPRLCALTKWVCSDEPRSERLDGSAAILPVGRSGVAQLVEQGTVNAKAVGSSPTPGALRSPAREEAAGRPDRPAPPGERVRPSGSGGP